jgi:hypothetical protein
MTKTPPTGFINTTMYHLAGALPQLKAWNDDGLTLYALTIVGANKGAMGGASIAGPAVDADGLANGWPAIARQAASEIFDRAPLRRAGAVTVIVILQAQNVSHCTLVNIPAVAPRAAPSASAPLPGRSASAALAHPPRTCAMEAGLLA